MKLYMIVHDCDTVSTKTHVGFAFDVNTALKRHNGVLPGGPRVTRKAGGHWKLAMIIVLPKHRDLLHVELVEYWKRSSRKHCRLSFGISMAKRLQVPWFINSDIFDMEDARRVIPRVMHRYFIHKRALQASERRARYEQKAASLFNVQTTPGNSILRMTVGRKRERRSVQIGFSRSWTGMSSEERLAFLSKRNTTLSESPKPDSDNNVTPRPVSHSTVSGKHERKTTVQAAPLNSLMSSLWLVPADRDQNNKRQKTLSSQNTARTSTITWPVAAEGF